jgi:hypothetical protein
MKGMHCGRYTGYLVTITMGGFSLAYEFDLLDYLNGDDLHAEYLSYLTPFLLGLGGLLAGIFMQQGRRKMLIVCDLILCTICIVSAFTNISWYIQLVNAIYTICYTFLFVVILIFTRETTTIAHSGLGIACFYGCVTLGYAVVCAIVYIANKSFPGKDLLDQTGFLILMRLVGLVPLVAQILLLLLYYKHDPPAHLVEMREEDEARKMLHFLCTSDDLETDINNEMLAAADAKKHTPMSWIRVCGCPYVKDVLFCMLLIFSRSCAGLYSNVLAVRTLSEGEQEIYNLVSKICYTIWAFGSIFLVDRYPADFLVRWGYVLVFCLNVAMTTLHAVYIYSKHYVLLLAIVSELSSLPFTLIITVPVLKFTVSLLCDKGAAFALIGYFLGYVCYTYPLGLLTKYSLDWWPFYLQLFYTFGSIAVGVFSTWYIKSQSSVLEQRTPQLSKKRLRNDSLTSPPPHSH